MIRQARLLFHTLRHSKRSQLTRRLRSLVKQQLGFTRLPAAPSDLRGKLTPRVPFRPHDPWNHAADLRRGNFRFLNQSAALGRPVNWQAADLPRLWQYNLHYFHYLHLLAPDEQRELCLDWTRHNPPGKGVAWHPYTTSLRIINWCKAGLADAELLASLYRQAAFLYRNLESHHPGNHILENARALIFAGCFFLQPVVLPVSKAGEAASWLVEGLEIYRRELPVQVLGDGGHFERSPMYHALIFEGCLDLLNILPNEPELADAHKFFTGVAKRMGDFLISVTHPDGKLALFNDATQEIAPPTAQLVDYAQSLLTGENERLRKKKLFAETGYFIHESEEIYMVIDGGAMAPDYLPSHAHGDIFSYELSLGGRQFIVDAGVFEYTAGEMRDYVRSTRAHNTVTVDRRDQAEFWGSFRVARRYPPEAVKFEQNGSSSRFQGEFGGYAKLLGDRIRHRRNIVCDGDKGEIEVRDVVEGGGRRRVESAVHLHPEVTVSGAGGRLLLARDGVGCVIEAGDGRSFQIADSWYCPQFGLRQKNKLLLLVETIDLPSHLSYKVTMQNILA